MKHLAAALLAIAAACGGDDGGSVTADARMADASTAKVIEIGCPLTPAATVMSTELNDTSYMPMASTVPAGGIVKFVMSPGHDVAPNPIAAMTDANLAVDFGETKCLKFNTAGTFGFFCSTHGFAGTVTVQ